MYRSTWGSRRKMKHRAEPWVRLPEQAALCERGSGPNRDLRADRPALLCSSRDSHSQGQGQGWLPKHLATGFFHEKVNPPLLLSLSLFVKCWVPGPWEEQVGSILRLQAMPNPEACQEWPWASQGPSFWRTSGHHSATASPTLPWAVECQNHPLLCFPLPSPSLSDLPMGLPLISAQKTQAYYKPAYTLMTRIQAKVIRDEH